MKNHFVKKNNKKNKRNTKVFYILNDYEHSWNKVSKKEASNLFLYGPYQLQLQFFKGCLLQLLLGSFVKTLSS